MILGGLEIMTGLTVLALPGQGPSVYGEVFLNSRASMVWVTWTEGESRSSSGFVVGAEGEVVFFAKSPPKGYLEGVLFDGQRRGLDLLGHDEATGLAVGRLRSAGRDSRPPPLPVAATSSLLPESWVVIIRAGERGPEPFAGVVQRRTKAGVLSVAAPGDPGGPVLSIQGEVLGVVTRGGRRSSVVVPFDGIIPFLRGVVLGP